MATKRNKKYALVYQAGIANVFRVNCFNQANYGRNATRILQLDFHTCEMFCTGLMEAGAKVARFYCNQAGDITNSRWDTTEENAPFTEAMHFKPNVI